MTRNVEELFGGVITAPHQIPFTYKSNVGGETFLSLPFYPVTGVVTINGGMQVPLDNFEIEGNTLNLGRALSKGDVVYCLFDKILSPEDTAKGIRIYKFQAVGGETEFTPDFTSYGVQSLYIGGEYKTPEIEYSYNSTTGKVSLQTALTAGVWVVAEMSVKQPNISPAFDRSIQEIARSANVKDSEVIVSTDTISLLDGKKVVYDIAAQTSYGLPTIPDGSVISSVSGGKLNYNPGDVQVNLLPLPLESKVDNFVNLLSSPTGTNEIGFKLSAVGSVIRTATEKLIDIISVKDFGAKGDGITDDGDAIQSAILYAESLPQLLTHPYSPVTVWFPSGSYRHTKPIRITQPIILDGEGVEIKAMAPYTGITVTLQSGGTEEFKGQLYVVHGNKGADSSEGQLRWGFTISKGILLSANDTAMSNIYMERFVNARINSTLQDSPTDGLVVGPSCWGLSTHALSIENFNRYAIHFLDKSAVNGATLDIRIWGNFKTGQAGILFDVGSACNGVTITGYIEKVDYGIIAARSTGAVLVSGVDFEQCTNRVLQASSDGSDGLTVGRITFKNCYLHSIGAAKIYAQNTVVSVEGCTLHAATADFETDANSTGYIYADNNDYLVGYAGVVPGSNVDVKFNKALVRDNRVYQPVKSTSFADVPVINLYQYKDAPSLLSSAFNFQSRWNNTDEKYEQESTWKVSDFYPSTSLQRECGVTLTTVGSFAIKPVVDNLINVGLPSYRFAAVYAVNGTIQTSDARHKNIRSIEEKEIAVGVALAPLMIAFTWKNSDDNKTHFGCSAQKVIEVFEKYGLDARQYGIVEYSEKADIYSVNYSQLLALCVAALANKLK